MRGVTGEGLWLAVAALVAAPLLASFFALLADRLPRDEPVLAGRSACRSCGRRLGAADLVPILSWVFLRGRCRGCGARIPVWLPLFELAALLLTAEALIVSGDPRFALLSAPLAGCLLAILVVDARHFYIPDMLSLPLVAAGLVLAALGWRVAPLDAAIGAAAGYLALWSVAVLYRALRGREGLGLGDAKLMAAGGALLGWTALPLLLLLASFCALATVLAMRALGARADAATAIPFGPFLAFGIWLLWLYPVAL